MLSVRPQTLIGFDTVNNSPYYKKTGQYLTSLEQIEELRKEVHREYCHWGKRITVLEKYRSTLVRTKEDLWSLRFRPEFQRVTTTLDEEDVRRGHPDSGEGNCGRKRTRSPSPGPSGSKDEV